MSYYIIIDEVALQELVESNIYQSLEFESGEILAEYLSGAEITKPISPRIVPTFSRDCLYMLSSRTPTGYLVIDSKIFDNLPSFSQKQSHKSELITVFQRICRFALKEWKGMSFAFSEMWSPTTGCGVVFPFPKSKNMGFRVTLKRPEEDPRITVRHGDRRLFAFAAGTKEESDPTQEQMRLFKRVFEELGQIRTSLEVQIKIIDKLPTNQGYHPLVLTSPDEKIRYQTYEQWMQRLTKSQKHFVTYYGKLPQRVEGAAGTGKTLSLILRSYHLCKIAEENAEECRVVFIAHTDATKNSTLDAMNTLGEPYYHEHSRFNDLQTIEVFTLQEWCGKLLGSKDLGEAQYLDQDALSAKELRRIILQDIIIKYQSNKAIGKYLSDKFKSIFYDETPEYLAELFQHEIGVMIKGRAAENMDAYLALPMLPYCLPTESSNDRKLVFEIYREYQKELNNSGVFDTDDIVLSTLGRLNTPIWRRRRETEGFDYIIIDETHLFNFNELSLFHYLLKDAATPKITFSIDRSQAPGNRGITSSLVKEVLMNSNSGEESTTKTDVIFRSSPQIVKLAEAITSTGASLFTAFENPFLNATSVITVSDEAISETPIYWKTKSDAEMCFAVSKRLKELCRELKCSKSDVLIVSMTEDMINQMKFEFDQSQQQYVILANRGDLEAVKSGLKRDATILSHPDYVGGLEFKAVLIVGVDEGRVPPTEGVVKEESRHFIEFKACNRLYVSISRARLRVELFYSSQRGSSRLLGHAVDSEALNMQDWPL